MRGRRKEGRKDERKEGRKEERKEGKKKGRKEGKEGIGKTQKMEKKERKDNRVKFVDKD